MVMILFLLVRSKFPHDLHFPDTKEANNFQSPARKSNLVTQIKNSKFKKQTFRKSELIRYEKVTPDNAIINQNLKLGDTLEVVLFKDVTLNGEIVKKEYNKLGTTSYVVDDNNSDSIAYITVNNGRVVISFDGENKSYRYIHSASSDSHYSLELNPDKMPKGHCGCDDFNKQSVIKQLHGKSKNPAADVQVMNDSADHIIDYMVVYTESSANYADENFGGIENALSQSQIRANYSLEISQTNTQLNLVESVLVDYTEPPIFYIDQIEYDLYALDDPNDGLIDEIHDIREEVNADLVTMFVNNLPEDYYYYYTAGIAWAPPQITHFL